VVIVRVDPKFDKRPHFAAIFVNPDADSCSISCGLIVWGYALLFGRPSRLWFGSTRQVH